MKGKKCFSFYRCFRTSEILTSVQSTSVLLRNRSNGELEKIYNFEKLQVTWVSLILENSFKFKIVYQLSTNDLAL